MSKEQFLQRTWLNVVLALLLPPTVGFLILSFVGAYPFPDALFVFTQYTGIYFIVCVAATWSIMLRFLRRLDLLLQSPRKSEAMLLKIFPLMFFAAMATYFMGGVTATNLSLEHFAGIKHDSRFFMYSVFGGLPAVLITALPIFFHQIEVFGRYLAPRGVRILMAPAWLKIAMLGLFIPLLSNSILISYYYDRTGYFTVETMLLWASLLLVAAAGSYIGWRSFRQGIAPFTRALHTCQHTGQHHRTQTQPPLPSSEMLVPRSLDEHGLIIAGWQELMKHLETEQQTLRKKQQELSDKQLMLTQIADNINEVFWVISPDGATMIYVSPAYEQIWGYSCQSLYDNPHQWMQAIHPEDFPRIQTAFVEKTANSEFDEEYRIVRADGEIRWIHDKGFAVKNHAGEVYRIAGIAEDISARKASEQALLLATKEMEQANRSLNEVHGQIEIFRRLAEFSRQGIGMASMDTKVQYFNPALKTMLDIPPDADLASYSFYEFYTEAQVELIKEKVLPEVLAKGFWTGEFDITSLSGDIIPTLHSVFVIKNPDGEPVALANVIADLTELKQVQRELQLHREHLEELVVIRTAELEQEKMRAEQASLAKSQFISNMSHELRTPLNAVLGFSQLLISDEIESLTPNQRENAQEILNAGNHLLDLINEILDLSKIEAGKLLLQEESLDVNELLTECLHLVDNFANQRNVKLNLQTTTQYTITADRVRLKQVLLNLLSNAIKYNQPGGNVEIRYEQKDNQHLAIHVSDTGQGIDYPDMDKLFQPFERLNQTGNAEGTGIGLSISKHLVELMQGEISVDSKVGKGSTFSVQLPTNRAA